MSRGNHRDGSSPQELLWLVQRLQKEANDRAGAVSGRGNVRADTTVELGEDPAPGRNGGSATEGDVALFPPIPPHVVSSRSVLRILSATMVRGWARGAGSVSPPPPLTYGGLIDGGTGNFNGLLR